MTIVILIYTLHDTQTMKNNFIVECTSISLYAHDVQAKNSFMMYMLRQFHDV